MGKKSKRKSNKSPPCYHGITKKEFNSGEHYKILEDYERGVDIDEFYETYKYVMVDPSFGRFVIAHIADDTLKGKDDDVILRHRRLFLLLHIRYTAIPWHEGKDFGPETKYARNYNKYCRDIRTERGRINCIAREIPCGCLEEKRIEAKSMEKVALCYCCRKEFSKKFMHRCLGCDHHQYCSKECSIKAWPEHKEICSSISTAAASAQSGGDSLPVLFGSLTHTPDTDGFTGDTDGGGGTSAKPL